MRHTVAVACLVFVAAAAGACDRDGPATTPGAATDDTTRDGGANGTVVRVVDGDTVVIDFSGREEPVRLIGIDTPEVAHDGDPAECYGDEASAFAKGELPPGTPVRVERDLEPRDAYGRLLGYLHRADDGLFFNHELVARGFATPLTIEPNITHAGAFVEAARSAESADTGLWAACRD